MLNLLILVIFLSGATYRVTRFLILDGLIDAQRTWVLSVILAPTFSQPTKKHRARHKLGYFLRCPYCLSVWLAAIAVVVTMQWVSIPLPVLSWFAIQAGSLVFWRYIEQD